MHVVCAGLPRSGSTWLYNTCRIAMIQRHGAATVSGYYIADQERSARAPIEVVKTHGTVDVQNLVPDATLSSVRDVRAAAASMVRMGWVRPERAFLKSFADSYIWLYNEWSIRADLMLRYEDILSAPRCAVSRISETLNLSLTDDAVGFVLDAVQALSPAGKIPSGTYDHVQAESLLHDGHIGDKSNEAAVRQLPEDIIAWMSDEYAAWLQALDYPCNL